MSFFDCFGEAALYQSCSYLTTTFILKLSYNNHDVPLCIGGHPYCALVMVTSLSLYIGKKNCIGYIVTVRES